MKRELMAAVIVVLVVLAGVVMYKSVKTPSTTAITSTNKNLKQEEIVVCNAGSLTIPLQKLAQEFTNMTGVKVLLEPSGSVDAVRKVTDLHKNCDVVAVADYRLLRMYMYPNYTKWYIAFASNRIVITYNSNLTKIDQNKINKNLTMIVNMLNNGKYGFSDPNRDPCGYRSVGVVGLISLYENNITILKDLIINKIPGSKYEIINGTLHIYIPASFTPKGNLVVRPKSIDLLSLLQIGELNYAFEYASVAKQHGLGMIELPDKVNLANPAYEDWYSKVVVHILVGTKDEKAIPMAPIVYGITVPSSAVHKDAAIKFVEFLLTNGRNTFQELGQPFLKTPLGYGDLPSSIRGLVESG